MIKITKTKNLLLKFHKNHNKIATLTSVKAPMQYGFLNINSNNESSIQYKLLQEELQQQNIYRDQIIDLNNKKLLDIGFDLLPKLINQMQGYEIKNFVLDMGTPNNLKLATDFVNNNPTLFNY